MMQSLKRDAVLLWYWIRAHQQFGLMPDFKEFFAIRREYQDGTRHYHTFEHIYECMMFMNRHYGFNALVVFALFYHDVVYVMTADDNEEQSALRWEEYGMRRQIQNAISWTKVRQISDMIRLTQKHFVDPKAPLHYRMMNDADMHILLASEERYLRYARDIWREYQAFGRPDYLAGRLGFLNRLDVGSVFYTHQAKSQVGQAKSNVNREIELLSTKPDKIMA